MDLICGKCAEPTDNDSLHDAVAEGLFANYRDAAEAFRINGCEALGWDHNAETMNSQRAAVAAVMMELNGDDMDGFASDMEDFEYFGMFGD